MHRRKRVTNRNTTRTRRSRGQRRRSYGWMWLLGSLAMVNVYLFFVRGLPSESDSRPTPGANPNDVVKSLSIPSSAGSIAEMRGVAGVRARHTAGRTRSGTLRDSVNPRFDLETARGIAGQRLLNQWVEPREDAVEPGENLFSAIVRSGVDRTSANDVSLALRGVLDFHRIRPGDPFLVWLSPSKRVERFVFRSGPLVAYRVDRQGDKLVGQRIEEKAEIQLAPVSVRIEDSLYASLERNGESAALVMALVDIFAWDIDFYLDTHPGDSVRLLVEKLNLNGRFVRYGRILAAEYSGDVGVRRAFWYNGHEERQGYYNEKGGSMRKAFLKSPLKFTRVTSGFGMRVHPILGYSRMHAAIDFGAPLGTPVWAPADGWVRSAGWNGNAGKMIALRHANGYETQYMHLQTIAAGVAAGQRVRQKQLIGTVGSSGLSTGPHLHYGMHLKGREVNPLSQRFPPADPVPADELTAFRQQTAPLHTSLEAIPFPLGGPNQVLAGKGRTKDEG